MPQDVAGMNRREEIVGVLAGQRNVRLPRALYGAGRWACRQTGLTFEDILRDPAGFASAFAGLFGGLDTDIIFPGSGMNTFPAEAIGGHLSFGDGQAPLLSFPLIQRREDASYLDTIDIGNSPYTLALIEMIANLREMLPDRFFCATSWGPFTWAMILCDWNLLKDKAAADPEFVREVCDLGVRLSRAFYGPLMERGLIDGIAIPDGATTLISMDLYRGIILPGERRLFEWAKGYGAWCFLHQCGKIEPQLTLYPETGAHCISVDNSVPIGDVYGLYREKAVTAGNVDVINTVLGGDPDIICRAVSECIAGVSDPHLRYILMPSCDLPPETPMRNVEAFLSCADTEV